MIFAGVGNLTVGSISLAIVDDVLVFGGSEGRLHAIHARSGTPLWSKILSQELVYRPIQAPGTELYDRMKREGRLIYEFDFYEGQTNTVPKMNPDVLSSGYRKTPEYICAPEHLSERAKTFLRDYQAYKPKRSDSGFRLRHLKVLYRYIGIFLRIVYHVGIHGNQGCHFWELFSWTCKNRPDNLDLALFFGV